MHTNKPGSGTGGVTGGVKAHINFVNKINGMAVSTVNGGGKDGPVTGGSNAEAEYNQVKLRVEQLLPPMDDYVTNGFDIYNARYETIVLTKEPFDAKLPKMTNLASELTTKTNEGIEKKKALEEAKKLEQNEENSRTQYQEHKKTVEDLLPNISLYQPGSFQGYKTRYDNIVLQKESFKLKLPKMKSLATELTNKTNEGKNKTTTPQSGGTVGPNPNVTNTPPKVTPNTNVTNTPKVTPNTNVTNTPKVTPPHRYPHGEGGDNPLFTSGGTVTPNTNVTNTPKVTPNPTVTPTGKVAINPLFTSGGTVDAQHQRHEHAADPEAGEPAAAGDQAAGEHAADEREPAADLEAGEHAAARQQAAGEHAADEREPRPPLKPVTKPPVNTQPTNVDPQPTLRPVNTPQPGNKPPVNTPPTNVNPAPPLKPVTKPPVNTQPTNVNPQPTLRPVNTPQPGNKPPVNTPPTNVNPQPPLKPVTKPPVNTQPTNVNPQPTLRPVNTPQPGQQAAGEHAADEREPAADLEAGLISSRR